MSFEPLQEHALRMIARSEKLYQEIDAIPTVEETLAQAESLIPDNDQDRSFGLMAQAARLLDYDLPFQFGPQTEASAAQARTYLDEALKLNPNNLDALRMKTVGDMPSLEAMFQWLCDHAPTLDFESEQHASEFSTVINDPSASEKRAQLAAYLDIAPTLRWYEMIVETAAQCGHYRKAIETVEALLETAPFDPSDSRFFGALLFAKMEDEDSLIELSMSTRKAEETSQNAGKAWFYLAYLALYFKLGRISKARNFLMMIHDAYRNATPILSAQPEMPSGIYARPHTAPGSDDELVLAVSDAAFLLQEGADLNDTGVLGTWVRKTIHELYPHDTIVAQEGDHEL